MVRRFPANDIHSLHPAVSFLVLAAGMAAAIAIIAGLCGVRSHRKMRKSPPLSPRTPKQQTQEPAPESQNGQKMAVAGTAALAAGDQLPLPPAMRKQLVGGSHSCRDMATRGNKSDQKKIAASLRMNIKVIARSLSIARYNNSNNNNVVVKVGDGSDEHRDSIWMKTIILGEKCKVPGDGDHDDQDHGVIYESFDGRKITAYHPRTASSLSIDRQCSFIDQDAISTRLDQHRKLVKN